MARLVRSRIPVNIRVWRRMRRTAAAFKAAVLVSSLFGAQPAVTLVDLGVGGFMRLDESLEGIAGQ